jgi:hypothetical protein
MPLILLVGIECFRVVDQVSVAVYTPLFVAGAGIDHRFVSQHGTTFVGNIQKVAVALLALFVLEGSIGLPAVLVVVVFVLNKMNEDVFDAVKSFCIEEVKGVMRGRKVAVHAVGYKPLGIVHMG